MSSPVGRKEDTVTVFNIFFKDHDGKNDYIVVWGRENALEAMHHYQALGYTNVMIGQR